MQERQHRRLFLETEEIPCREEAGGAETERSCQGYTRWPAFESLRIVQGRRVALPDGRDPKGPLECSEDGGAPYGGSDADGGGNRHPRWRRKGH